MSITTIHENISFLHTDEHTEQTRDPIRTQGTSILVYPNGTL